MDRYHAYGVREVDEEGMIRRDSRGRMAALWGHLAKMGKWNTGLLSGRVR